MPSSRGSEPVRNVTTRTLSSGIPTTEAATLPPRQHPTCSSTIFAPFFRRCVIRPAKLDRNDKEKRFSLTRADGLYALPSLDEGRALLSGYCSTSAFEDSHQTNDFETHLIFSYIYLSPGNGRFGDPFINFSHTLHASGSPSGALGLVVNAEYLIKIP